MKTSTLVTSTYEQLYTSWGWEMNGHEAMRLSSDCSGTRFKASRVLWTAPFGAY